jgi:hypothetical protein
MITIPTEDLAYWFLRLNGCLTTRNFIVHPEGRRDDSGTDADVLAVRFPHRQELQIAPLKDHQWFNTHPGRLLVLIAEVKKGLCALNGPWTNRERRNVSRVLQAIGVYPFGEISIVADALYGEAMHDTGAVTTALVVFGGRENPELMSCYPRLHQFLWNDVLSFIYGRFTAYEQQKAWHQPWDKAGSELYDTACRCSSATHFQSSVLIE